MTEPPSDLYRSNVGIVVFNSQGEVLQGERIEFAGAWQFPQGGIDEGESPLAAAQRELYEEVGIGDAVLVYEYPDWLYYDFPEAVKAKFQLAGKKSYQGQKQRWFLFYWDHPATMCQLDAHQREFRQVRFVPISQSADHIVEFKRAVYEQVIAEFTPRIQAYLQKK